MKKASEVFNNIRFAKGESRGKQHSSTDNEEHYTVGEKEYEQQIKHVKKMAMQEDSLKSACWKGYTAIGMKVKNGRKVPNCVPVKEDAEELNEMPGANMDTRAVHSHLKKKGWKLSRTAGSHDVFTHPEAEHHIAVPRHKQLKAPLVKGILKQSEIKEERNETLDPKSHQYKVTMKHAKNPTVQQRMAAHDIRPGIKGYRDRVDLLKDLERTGRIKKEEVLIRCIMCYVIQRTDVESFQPSIIDPEYRSAFYTAMEAGVEVITLVVGWTREGKAYFVKDNLKINM